MIAGLLQMMSILLAAAVGFGQQGLGSSVNLRSYGSFDARSLARAIAGDIPRGRRVGTLVESVAAAGNAAQVVAGHTALRRIVGILPSQTRLASL